jgi:hypothetical protein
MTQKVLCLEKLAALHSLLEVQGFMLGTTSQYMAHTLSTSDRSTDDCSSFDDRDRDSDDSYKGNRNDYSDDNGHHYDSDSNVNGNGNGNNNSNEYDDDSDVNGDESDTNIEDSESGKCFSSLPLHRLRLLQKMLTQTLCFLVAVILKQMMAELKIP